MEDFEIAPSAEAEEAAVVVIDAAQLQHEFVHFPGLLSRMGARYADSITEAARLGEELKDLEAEVFLELRAKKEKSQTEAELKALVRTDKRVRLKRAVLLAADARQVRYEKKVMAALHAKREMLVSLGAHQRAELGGDPLTRRAVRDERTTAELERLAEQRLEREERDR